MDGVGPAGDDYCGSDRVPYLAPVFDPDHGRHYVAVDAGAGRWRRALWWSTLVIPGFNSTFGIK